MRAAERENMAPNMHAGQKIPEWLVKNKSNLQFALLQNFERKFFGIFGQQHVCLLNFPKLPKVISQIYPNVQNLKFPLL